MVRILAIAAGIIGVGFMPWLPPFWLGTAFILLGAFLWSASLFWKRRGGVSPGVDPPAAWCSPATGFSAPAVFWGAVTALFWGAGWAVVHGHQVLNDQLAPQADGRDFWVTGRIIGLPRAGARGWRFEFEVLEGESENAGELPSKLMLSWYIPVPAAVEPRPSPGAGQLPASQGLAPGEIWRLHVRLKRPRGFVNPGGFDYQGWLLAKGIGATGYVRDHPDNHRLRARGGASVSVWRHRIRRALERRDRRLSHRPVLKALAIGDRGELDTEWALFRRTGTSHLMAISGLHIGLLASLGYLVGRLTAVPLLLVFDPFRGVTRAAAALGALAPALLYSALAGFALPTQRAVVMVAVANLALLCRKPLSAFRTWATALLCVLLPAPLAGHNAGFWLSFCAVGALLFAFSGTVFSGAGRRPNISDPTVRPRPRPRLAQNLSTRVQQFLRAQWVAAVGLLLPLLVLGLSATAVSPLANLVAIPLISWGVVPPLLLGLGMLPVWSGGGWALIGWADRCVAWTLQFLQWCDRLALPSGWLPFEPGPGRVLLGASGILLLLLPRGVPHRWLGGLCLLCLLFPRLGTPPALKLTVLDVGQGLAAVAQAAGRTLVFDTGPRYSERFDAGSGILAPFLRRQGIGEIDRLIVSHGDSDHRGGLSGLLEAVAVRRLLWGETLAREEEASRLSAGPVVIDHRVANEIVDARARMKTRRGKTASRRCRAGQAWVWGPVEFRILSPPGGSQPARENNLYRGNNASCVLLIRYGSQSVLLSGDIEEPVERRLLEAGRLPAKVSVLVAPHHGSRTSSSAAFVQRLRPRVVVFSAGFGSRYGHPHETVAQRYRAAGSEALNTATAGAVTFIWDRDGDPRVRRQRRLARRWWFTEAARGEGPGGGEGFGGERR